MLLRDSGSPRCSCMAGVEETEPWTVDRICVYHPRRDCVH